MIERRIRVTAKAGLHSTPAADFVKTAAPAPARVTVAKAGRPPVDGKSILGVLGLDAHQGEELTITADGDGADELLDRLEHILSRG